MHVYSTLAMVTHARQHTDHGLLSCPSGTLTHTPALYPRGALTHTPALYPSGTLTHTPALYRAQWDSHPHPFPIPGPVGLSPTPLPYTPGGLSPTPLPYTRPSGSGALTHTPALYRAQWDSHPHPFPIPGPVGLSPTPLPYTPGGLSPTPLPYTRPSGTLTHTPALYRALH